LARLLHAALCALGLRQVGQRQRVDTWVCERIPAARRAAELLLRLPQVAQLLQRLARLTGQPRLRRTTQRSPLRSLITAGPTNDPFSRRQRRQRLTPVAVGGVGSGSGQPEQALGAR